MSKSSVSIEKGTIYVFPESACMLAIDGLDALILVKQYRKPRGEYTLELPGGVVNFGEKPEITAIREFREETGLESFGCEFTFTLDLDLSTALHRTHVFTARTENNCFDLKAEFTVCRLQMADALSMIRDGSITHAPTVAAILARALDIKQEVVGE